MYLFLLVSIRGTLSYRRKCQFMLCYKMWKKMHFFSFSPLDLDLFFWSNLGQFFFMILFKKILSWKVLTVFHSIFAGYFVKNFKCHCIAPAPLISPTRTHFRTHNPKRLRTEVTARTRAIALSHVRTLTFCSSQTSCARGLIVWLVLMWFWR